MKLEELISIRENADDAQKFVSTHDALKHLKPVEQSVWVEFYKYDEVSCKKILAFLETMGDNKTTKIKHMEDARASWLKFAKSKGLIKTYKNLYRTTMYDDHDEDGEPPWEEGEVEVIHFEGPSYWSSSEKWAKNFIDEDEGCAVISCKYNPDDILFDLNVLPYIGGNLFDEREDELLMRDGSYDCMILEKHDGADWDDDD